MEYLVFFFFCGLSAGTIGRIKGSSFFIWFLVGFCLPIIGTVLALVWRWEKHEPMRRCEDCGAIVPVHDQVCMSCGRDLEFPEEVFTLGRSVESATGGRSTGSERGQDARGSNK